MRNTTPSLRFVLRFLLLVVAGTNVDSFFHCAPHLPSTIIRRKQSRRHQNQQRGLLEAAGKPDGDQQDVRRRNDKFNNRDHGDVTSGESSFDRRSFLWASPYVLMGASSPMLSEISLQPLQMYFGATSVKAAMLTGNESDSDKKNERLTDQIMQSLVFERILGSGSYKTVYLVSATIPALEVDCDRDDLGSTRTFRYALAVERLRNKSDVKNAFRGVLIPDLIRQGLNDTDGDGELFETIIDWWVQSSTVQEFRQGQRVFPIAAAASEAPVDIDKTLGRTRSEPKKNFVGSRWMLSFKPVYETDFKRFVRNAPALFPVEKGNVEKIYEGKTSHGDKLPSSRSYYWTEPVLMAFILEILHAGKLMHETGIVHRDIKPKNMMISIVPSTSGSYVKRPVIIDYGFSEVGSPLLLEVGGQGSTTGTNAPKKRKDICVVRPGQLKGEVDYVLAEDLANYRGCQRGDAYAMGKTLYEFVFGSAELQEQNQDDQGVITLDGAEMQNQKFRDLLFNDNTAGTESRFRLSRGAADCLLLIMRGLCGNQNDATRALTFAEAEDILWEYLSPSSSR